MLSQSGRLMTRDTSSRQSSIVAAIPVLSLSHHAYHLLQEPHARGRILGRFRRAVDLLIGAQVLALVTPEIGDGPFNVVVPHLPQLPRQFTLRSHGGGCNLGPLPLHFDAGTRLWDARPPWSSLRFKPSALRTLRDVIAEAAARSDSSPLAAAVHTGANSRVAELNTALRSGDSAAIRDAAAGLAGWGPGLTPSGDDYLAGFMLGLWAIPHSHDRELDTEHALVSSFAFSRAELCAWITQAAAPRTTRISRAFLRVARDGLADVHWHTLLYALADGEPSTVERAAQTVLAFGATSGFDMLLGFLHVHECL